MGFGSVVEGEPRLILGKRDATQRGIEETNQGEEAQRLKRKKNGDYSTDSTARVLEHNENIKLELPRTLKPLDSSKSSQYCEGSSYHDLFSYENKVGQERL